MPDEVRKGPSSRPVEHLDVLIVGAGISGIGAAVHLSQKCPDKSFAVLEAREAMGGTWDLFKYPGIRSDSDMYTLGFSFKPWTNPKAIADGPSILAYLEDTAAEFGVDKKIRFGKRLESANWSTRDAQWEIEVRDVASGELESMTCGFLYACTGYYRYDRGYTPEFVGRDDFEGEIIHPQIWPEDLDYSGKKVVVIGSGATAMTIVPEMAKTAAHVTMLQRSPTYVVSAPSEDRIANFLREKLPGSVAYEITRWKNVGFSMLIYGASKRFPKAVKRLFLAGVKKALPNDYDVETHFTPSYNPWDQRVCLVPEGDLFEALKSKRASVVTDHIDRFTAKGIRLRSGEELEADIIITATGLELQLFGGATLSVDGKDIQPNDTMAYRAMMVGDVPNMAFAVGYTNASWTLKVDLVAEYVCRLLKYMDAKGYTVAYPKSDPDMPEAPLLDFSAGYIKRALPHLPRGGQKHPWRVFENYALDRATLLRAPIDDGVMHFARTVPKHARRDARATVESRR